MSRTVGASVMKAMIRIAAPQSGHTNGKNRFRLSRSLTVELAAPLRCCHCCVTLSALAASEYYLAMQVATGKVIDGKVVVDGVVLP